MKILQCPISAGFDVFFRHAWSDKLAVRPIVEALRAAGLKGWLDEGEIESQTSITQNIVPGLANSKVLVAYYSQNRPERPRFRLGFHPNTPSGSAKVHARLVASLLIPSGSVRNMGEIPPGVYRQAVDRNSSAQEMALP